jgi:hypothetical protein
MSKLVQAAFTQGMNDAIQRFTKNANIGEWVGGAKNFLVGQPGKAFIEGPRAFRPGGMLSHENIWWPSTQGLVGKQKVMPWLQRAGTMAIPFQLMSAAHNDPHEGTLSNVLGTAGSIAGTMYGMPALGMLGAPVLSNIGSRIGHGIGHMLGSKPKEPDYP